LDGIFIDGESNTIIGNNLTNNENGISLYYSDNNTIVDNNILDCEQFGIWMYNSLNNLIYHNNFVNNTKQADIQGSVNSWDDGYPSGGNYWSDYDGTDLLCGPYQNTTSSYESDGIGDTSYNIDENNQDNYPLMGIFSDLNATSEFHVQTICNSSITDFQFNSTVISFNVLGENDTTGFCRICIPIALMNAPYKVVVNGTQVSYNLLPCSNETYSYLYFNYTHSTEEVVIIPEFLSVIILPLLMVLSLLAVVFAERKIPRRGRKDNC
jgi:parallel beta-helix repeat protein